MGCDAALRAAGLEVKGEVSLIESKIEGSVTLTNYSEGESVNRKRSVITSVLISNWRHRQRA
jgi:hypothetical protein